MQAIVKLTLKAPFKLRVVQVAFVQVKIIGVHGNGRILELDDDLHALSLPARGEVQERVLVEAQLGKHAFQAAIGYLRHTTILADRSAKFGGR